MKAFKIAAITAVLLANVAAVAGTDPANGAQTCRNKSPVSRDARTTAPRSVAPPNVGRTVSGPGSR